MGEKFCRMAGVHVAIHIVCNQINIDCEHPNPTKSIYCTRMSVSSFGSANQITSDAREEKKASAANGVRHQPATMLWSLRKPSSDAHDMISAATLWFLVVKATATSSPPAMLWPDA